MPAAPPAGWQRVVTSDFNETTALGAWPGPEAARFWKNRQRGSDTSGRGTYDSSKTISEANGILDVWIHSEGDRRYVAAPVSAIGATHGARISVCMRADAMPGYKIAFLLWPTEGDGNSLGEIDFPESKLDGPPTTAHAFMHYAPEPSDGKRQDWFDSGAFLQDWHAYTIEWNPKASQPYVRFFVDGRLIGESTQFVPWVPMFYVMQIETYLGNEPLPPPTQGHVQVDWATIEVP
jgi:hypothetical protein